MRNDTTKGTTNHASRMPTCGSMCSMPIPCSMLPRMASMPAVSGKCAHKGLHHGREPRRGKEHARQDPHGQHDQVHQARHRFHRLGARRNQQAQPGERHRSHQAEQRQLPERPAKGHAEGDLREAQKERDFDDQHRQPREQERRKVLPLGHRRSHQPLEQLLLPRLDNRKAQAPTSPSPSGSCPAVPAPRSRCSARRFHAPARLPRAPHPCVPQPPEWRDRPAAARCAHPDSYRRICRQPRRAF